MPADLKSRKEASLSEGARGLADMLASALRGGVVGAVGLPGDLEDLLRSTGTRVLPTSKEVDTYLPETGADKGFKVFEGAGEYLPVDVAGPIVKGAKPLIAALKGSGPAMAALAAFPKARKDLALYHATELAGGLPQELTHPSLAITTTAQGATPNFGGNYMVADPRKFEPRTSPTVIKATDFYSPRKEAAAHDFLETKDSMRAWKEAQHNAMLDEQPRLAARAQEGLEFITKKGAKQRLADKFKEISPRGGAFTEGRSVLGPWELDTKYGPRFQSFEHFENAPAGAARLDKYSDTNLPVASSQRYMEVLDPLDEAGYTVSMPGQRPLPISNIAESEEGFRKIFSPEFLQQHGMRDYQKLTKEEATKLAETLRSAHRKYIAQGPSEYAEVKRFGQVPLTGESFPHAILQPDQYRTYAETLRKRGVNPINIAETGIPLNSEGIPDLQRLNQYIADLQTQLFER